MEEEAAVEQAVLAEDAGNGEPPPQVDVQPQVDGGAGGQPQL